MKRINKKGQYEREREREREREIIVVIVNCYVGVASQITLSILTSEIQVVIWRSNTTEQFDKQKNTNEQFASTMQGRILTAKY